MKPGETTEVIIVERQGAVVKGRLVAPANKPVNWIKDMVHMQMTLESSRFAPGFSAKDEGTLAAVDFWTSPVARQYINSRISVSFRRTEDGSFISVERVPAGEYQFSVTAKNAWAHRKVTVTPQDEQQPYLELGTIELQ